MKARIWSEVRLLHHKRHSLSRSTCPDSHIPKFLMADVRSVHRHLHRCACVQVLWQLLPHLQALPLSHLTMLLAACSLASDLASICAHSISTLWSRTRRRRLWGVHGASPTVLGMLCFATLFQQAQQSSKRAHGSSWDVQGVMLQPLW